MQTLTADDTDDTDWIAEIAVIATGSRVIGKAQADKRG
jgi:hypothetical protein